MDASTLHRAKLRIGIGIATYEAIALAVDDPAILPPLTWMARRWPWLGYSMALWCVVHLALPPTWIRTCTRVTSAPSATR